MNELLSARPILLFAPLVLAASLLVARQTVATPELVLAGAAGLLYVALTTWSLTAGLAVFTVLTFPEHLPSSAVSTLAKPAGLVLVFSWLLVMLSRRKDTPFLPRDQPLLMTLATCFLVWAAASALWATDAGETMTGLTRLLQVVLLLLIVHSAVRSTRDLQVLCWAFLVGALFTAVYSMATGSYSEAGRLSGIFDSNFFAAQLVAAMALGFFMVASVRGWSVRLLLAAMLTTYVVAFALTQSRGGLLALGAALLAMVVFAGRWRPQSIAVALIVVGIGVAYYGSFAASEVRQRITNVSAEGSAGRADEWRIGVEMLRDHPVAGVGLGNFSVLEPAYGIADVDLLKPQYVFENRLETHNTYLQVASELGLVGLGLVLTLVAGTFMAGIGAVRRFDRSGDVIGEALTRGLIVATVGILSAYVFLSGLFEKQLWLLLGIVIATHFVAKQQARHGPSSKNQPEPSGDAR